MTLYDFFKGEGFDFYTGVPCSEIKGFLRDLDEKSPGQHVVAVREDDAIGAAVGAWLGGRCPLVYMQNSGLGNSVNAINSLLLPYQIPVHLLVTMHQGAEHQAFTYATTKPLIDLLGYRERTYFAQKDTLEDSAMIKGPECEERSVRERMQVQLPPFPRLSQEMPWTRKESITRILESYDDGNTVFVSTNGYISREHCALGRGLGFYMAGSMGLAPAIGFGLAFARLDVRVVVINGDGGYLMNLGMNATIAEHRLPNLKHFVLKNGLHETTGGQPLVDVPVVGEVEILEVRQGGDVPPRISIPLQDVAHNLRRALWKAMPSPAPKPFSGST